MNIKEYLSVLNGIAGKEEIVSSDIKMIGFIDIVPDIGDLECSAKGQADLDIDSENIIIRRAFDTEYGRILLKKKTPLSDDISLHCGKNGTPEQALKLTIEALTQIQSSDEVNFQNQIDVFAYVLENYEQKEKNSGPKAI